MKTRNYRKDLIIESVSVSMRSWEETGQEMKELDNLFGSLEGK